MYDGTVGALYNDATRMALRGATVRYWERLSASSYTEFRLLSHAPEMSKKVFISGFLKPKTIFFIYLFIFVFFVITKG